MERDGKAEMVLWKVGIEVEGSGGNEVDSKVLELVERFGTALSEKR